MLSLSQDNNNIYGMLRHAEPYQLCMLNHFFQACHFHSFKAPTGGRSPRRLHVAHQGQGIDQNHSNKPGELAIGPGFWRFWLGPTQPFPIMKGSKL